MTLSALGIFSAAGAGGGVALSDYELISTSIVSGSSTSSITFDVSSFASTYKHLQIRMVGRPASTNVNFFMQFNGDSGSNYNWHELYKYTFTGTVTSGAGTNQTSLKVAYSDSSVSTSYGVSVIDVLDAFSTSKNTTIRALNGALLDPFIALRSGAWRNTAALNSIYLYCEGGAIISAGSRFSLYGIKG
jgi:hypothetical protein